jgi:hypothetical protein
VQTAAIQWELVREQTERELIQHNLEHPLDITVVSTSQTPAPLSSQEHPNPSCTHATPKKLTSSPSTKAAVPSSVSPSPAPNSSTVTTEPPAPPALLPKPNPAAPVAKDPPQPELQNNAVPLFSKSARPSLQSLWHGVESVPQSYLRPIPRKVFTSTQMGYAIWVKI